MSRNSEVLFSSLPSIDIQRSVLDIPHDHKTTFNVGELIPFACYECLPSDSVKIRTNKVIRLQTLIAPIMSNIVADTFWFFVPNRLVWSHWKQFMGENTESAYLPEVTYRPPKILFGGTNGAMVTGDILDYFGMPILPNTGVAVSPNPVAFPLRAYWLIWNEFFRDQNLQDPINIPLGDSDMLWKDVSDFMKKPLPVNRLHDYFSSALIAPAKNAEGFVTAWTSKVRASNNNPLQSGQTPVFAGGDLVGTSDYALHLSGVNQTSSISGFPYVKSDFAHGDSVLLATNGATNPVGIGDAVNYRLVPDNLYANALMTQYGITIPSLRQAFQMQKFLEREASHGSRYQETLLSHFSVRALDSRLQRPEYLGGNRIPINITQVVNQSQADSQSLGDVGAFSLTTDSHYDVEFSCSEHGYIIGLTCLRYKNSYQNGFNRQFFKENRFSYAWPEFAHLTDQPINNWEIYVPTGVTQENMEAEREYANGIFGYQERYAEYKYMPDIVSGEMRAGITNSLASWHLGDYYTSDVYLSDEWLRMSKAPVDRTLAVTSAVSNQVFADFYCQCRWTRPLPVHSNPGFADHF